MEKERGEKLKLVHFIGLGRLSLIKLRVFNLLKAGTKSCINLL